MVTTEDAIGTAFAVGRHELVTAAHVVEGDGFVRVRVNGSTRPADVVKMSRRRDLALLEVTGSPLAPLQLAGRDAPVGTQVFAAGAAA